MRVLQKWLCAAKMARPTGLKSSKMSASASLAPNIANALASLRVATTCGSLSGSTTGLPMLTKGLTSSNVQMDPRPRHKYLYCTPPPHCACGGAPAWTHPRRCPRRWRWRRPTREATHLQAHCRSIAPCECARPMAQPHQGLIFILAGRFLLDEMVAEAVRAHVKALFQTSCIEQPTIIARGAGGHAPAGHLPTSTCLA